MFHRDFSICFSLLPFYITLRFLYVSLIVDLIVSLIVTVSWSSGGGGLRLPHRSVNSLFVFWSERRGRCIGHFLVESGRYPPLLLTIFLLYPTPLEA